MKIEDAAIAIIRPHLDTVQDYQRKRPRVTPPSTRKIPSKTQVWRRYCFSMITRQQRISNSFWNRVFLDRTWRTISESYPKKRPHFRVVQDTLHHLNIRFADSKARQICNAWDRDFATISKTMRTVLSHHHDRGYSNNCRSAELEVAHLMQVILSGCGVGPKIARLMMLWDPANGMGLDFRYVIPIDSRWVNCLIEAGVDPSLLNISTENRYRRVETHLVTAAYELGIFPCEADGIIFGWIRS